MSGDDVQYIRRKSRQQLWVILATMIPSALIIMSAGINTFVKLHDKADKEYVDDTYIELYVLVNAQQVNLANYIKARDEDKEALWKEIHRMQDQIHYHSDAYKDVKRGMKDTLQTMDKRTVKELQVVHLH